MELTVGQVFTVSKAFSSPPGAPKSKYIEGGSYRVTDANKDFVAEHIDAGDAILGEPMPKRGVKLNSAPALLAGQATVR